MNTLAIIIGVPIFIVISYALVRMWGRAWHLSRAEVYNNLLARRQTKQKVEPGLD